MASTLPVPTTQAIDMEESFESVVCSIFDAVEEKLDELTPTARKGWLENLSETVKRSDARHGLASK